METRSLFFIFLYVLLFFPTTTSPENVIATSEPHQTEPDFIQELYFCFKEYCSPKKDMMMISPANNQIKNIIFDLNEVLFQTSRSTYLKNVHHLIPYAFQRLIRGESFSIKHFFEAAISDIPSERNEQTAYHEGTPLPAIMNDWQCGKDIYQIVLDHINAKKIPGSDKKFLRAIAKTCFDPQEFAASKKPILHTVQMVKDLKEAGYKVYVLSNWDAQSFPLFKEKQSEIMNLFDGIMISGNQGLVKPDVKLFERCVETFNLSPAECLFIDDQSINVQAAQAAGMSAFVFYSQDRPGIISSLQSYNIIDRAE